MQVRHIWLAGEQFLYISGEGIRGAPEAQFSDLLDRVEGALAEFQLTMEHAVFHRLWMRSPKSKDAISGVRAKRFTDGRRTASSSFFSNDRFFGTGDVALDLLVKYDSNDQSRQIVDFDPPRRYAHYLASGDWLFLSGMAEEADKIDEQFVRSLAEVERALEHERIQWQDVVDVCLFIERGRGSAEWLSNAFQSAAPACAARIAVEKVDGLASPGKHLEIEIIARRRG